MCKKRFPAAKFPIVLSLAMAASFPMGVADAKDDHLSILASESLIQNERVQAVSVDFPVQRSISSKTTNVRSSSSLTVTSLETLDVDGDGAVETSTDGLLVVRFMLGLRGQSLIQDALGPAATRNTADAVAEYLRSLISAYSSTGSTVASLETLDVDGNGHVDALTDGLLVVRFMLGLRGQSLIQGALGQGATRNGAEIQDHLSPLISTLPAGCSMSASPASSAAAPLASGTQVTITANCATGLLPITYNWDGGAYIGSVRTVTPSQDTTYSVTASNAAGQNVIQTSVFVGSQQQNFCTGADQILNVGWPAAGQIILSTNGFGTQRLAFRITVPMTFSPALNINHLGFVHMGEAPLSPPTPREFTVSRNSCDFQSPGQYIYDGTGYAVAGPAVSYTVNNPTGYFGVGGDFNLMSGDVVYVNVRNSNNGVPACGYSACDMLFDFATPNRY